MSATSPARRAYVHSHAVACALGANRAEVAANLFSAAPPTVAGRWRLADGRDVPVGALPFELPSTDLGQQPIRSRTNRMLGHVLKDIGPAVAAAIDRYGAARVGVVLGTSTSGVDESLHALRGHLAGQAWPEGYHFDVQELNDPVAAAQALTGATGPAYAVSTACTSGAKAIAAGARLIAADLCDAVLCGGLDTLCDLTLNGFGALEALSPELTNPFSLNRKGINIGEGAGLFLLTVDEAAVRVAGWGETSDAHHISAPDPTGAGGEAAARKALAMAGLDSSDIGYVHLHGTGTELNDRMEAGVINRVFGVHTPVSSTKPLTGHTLGAAGAVQASFCLLAFEHGGALPPHIWDGEADPELAPVRLAAPGDRASGLRHALSASYAFGGNNAAVILSQS
ncbi:MAG: beta-ketoacyl-ACP synthase [Caulobacteraceae bacterium]|nr:MAG: beta-ketoacyl-ACP synthase [Caulobacteraceae bacterium]